MFAQWRLTLRQAEEAVRAERFEEALELARRPEVADHCRAGQLRNRVALQLVERAREHVRQGHSQAAWHDLRQAELAGAPNAKVTQVRGELTERGAAEVRAALDAGDPSQAMTLADDLRNRGADSAELRRLYEAATAWARAQRAAKLGEFNRAIEFLETAARQIGGHECVEQKLKSMQRDRERAAELRGQLQGALAAQNWLQVLQTADAFLEIAPDCREVKQTRDEALRRLGVRVTSATNIAPPSLLDDMSPVRSPLESKNGSRNRFILWVDGVGGFLVCQGNVVTLGQANPGCTVDVPILGDLSRQHATIVRDGEGYLIRSDRDLTINGRPARQATLRDGDVIRLGRSVDLKFTMPCPVSGTARLELVSRHRLHLSLAGILLMADTCVLGASAQTHVQVPESTRQIVLYRQGDHLICRGDGVLEIDGQPHEGRGSLRSSSRVIAGDFSFSLEPLGSPLNQV
jgi:tetratricopeptide (TPR) repeat protein